jgi:(R,R)-butanediol dehydrogenase/meso-butanediol dehydrogenase/diacetyl reductase
MTSVRTATVSAPHQLDIREADAPMPATDQVVVQVRYCGVCGTDVHGFESPELLPRAVFGHEWTGTIVDTGGGVETVSVGDRVSVAVGPPCGRCSMCRSGSADHCDTVFADANGVSPDAPDHGGFSTHITVSRRRVVKLLEGLSDEQGALVEPTAVTFRAVRRTMIPLGSVVVVQGAGPIGLLCAQQARHAGPARTFVVEPVPARREAATALGFADAFEPGATFTDALRAATDGRGADVLFECTGVAKLLQPSAELVRRGGTLSLVGYTAELSSVSYGDWVTRELRLVASLAYAHQDFLGAMAMLASRAVEIGPVVTGTVGLSELGAVLTDLRSGSTQHAKVLVDPTR